MDSYQQPLTLPAGGAKSYTLHLQNVLKCQSISPTLNISFKLVKI